MEVRKRITAIVPSELLYAFDPDHEHVFVVTREKGKIVSSCTGFDSPGCH